jgi:DNA-binding NtrC family response regulator
VHVPARIVLVHEDAQFVEKISSGLTLAGYHVATFTDSMDALAALEDSKTAELLISGVRFGLGRPNGVSLARMARLKRPKIKILFTDPPEFAEHTEGVGDFMPLPADFLVLRRAVERLLTGDATGEGRSK